MQYLLEQTQQECQDYFGKPIEQLTARDVLTHSEKASELMSQLRTLAREHGNEKLAQDTQYFKLFNLLSLVYSARVMCAARGFSNPNDFCHLYSQRQIEAFIFSMSQQNFFIVAMIIARGEHEKRSLFHSFKVLYHYAKFTFTGTFSQITYAKR